MKHKSAGVEIFRPLHVRPLRVIAAKAAISSKITIFADGKKDNEKKDIKIEDIGLIREEMLFKL